MLITNDNCEIRDASHLWGMDYFETEEKLSEELKQKRWPHDGDKSVLFNLLIELLQATVVVGSLPIVFIILIEVIAFVKMVKNDEAA